MLDHVFLVSCVKYIEIPIIIIFKEEKINPIYIIVNIFFKLDSNINSFYMFLYIIYYYWIKYDWGNEVWGF